MTIVQKYHFSYFIRLHLLITQNKSKILSPNMFYSPLRTQRTRSSSLICIVKYLSLEKVFFKLQGWVLQFQHMLFQCRARSQISLNKKRMLRTSSVQITQFVHPCFPNVLQPSACIEKVKNIYCRDWALCSALFFLGKLEAGAWSGPSLI